MNPDASSGKVLIFNSNGTLRSNLVLTGKMSDDKQFQGTATVINTTGTATVINTTPGAGVMAAPEKETGSKGTSPSEPEMVPLN